MTYNELLTSDKPMLVPTDIADIIGCMPHSINVQAQTDPAKLGFPVCVLGTRVKIPREGFIRWLKYGDAPVLAEEGA